MRERHLACDDRTAAHNRQSDNGSSSTATVPSPKGFFGSRRTRSSGRSFRRSLDFDNPIVEVRAQIESFLRPVARHACEVSYAPPVVLWHHEQVDELGGS
ncbi:MAG: hypothetical protein IT379_34165 [Deltaproteobacteria bacterium]|nr:hypothetical protein [Deltaproteobacteria bacterium]